MKRVVSCYNVDVLIEALPPTHHPTQFVRNLAPPHVLEHTEIVRTFTKYISGGFIKINLP